MEIQDLEAIIQRHAQGDRGPDLLARLNAAAWECYHDPWEPEPLCTAEAALVEALDLMEALELPEPEGDPRSLGDAPLLAEKLTAYLEVHRWPFTRDASGAFMGTPTFRGMENRDLILRLSTDPGRPRILRFEMGSTWQVPAQASAAAGTCCDQWNASGHRVFARLDLATGTLRLGGEFALPQPVTLKALVGFLDGCVVDARAFWLKARQEAEGWAP